MADLLTIEYKDAHNVTGSFSAWIDPGYTVASAEVLAMIQAFRNLTQCQVVEASIAKKVDLSTLTNPAPSTGGSYDRVRMQAQLQLARADNTGFLTVTVPAPVDGIFQTSGAYAMQDVDPADALIVAWVAAAITEPILVTPQGGAVTFRKGWLKGQPHS